MDISVSDLELLKGMALLGKHGKFMWVKDDYFDMVLEKLSEIESNNTKQNK